MYENIVFKADDFISYVQFFYFNEAKSDRIRPRHKKAKDIWKPIDLKLYGRCYTAHPTPEMIKFGIKSVWLLLWARSLVFFHNPGMLTTDRQRNVIDIALGKKFDVDLEHEVFRMLDFGGESCNADPHYDKDICAHQILHQVRFS